jgi:hypothetical protein
MRFLILLSSVALALTACGRPSNAPTMISTSAGQADAAPHRKSGLWEQTISRDGANSATARLSLCVDESLETKAAVFSHDGAAKASDHCGPTSVTRGADGGYSFTSTCDIGSGGTATSHGVASGDFASGYHVRLETQVAGASDDGLNGRHVTLIDSRYIGACPAGMAPGDVRLANGMTLNPGKLRAAAASFGLH